MRSLFLTGLLAVLAGCATVPENARVAHDPWQGYNRAMFKFNDKLDKAVLKPVTIGYRKVTPDLVETGISNFFSNLDDIGNSLNNLLQGKPLSAGSDLLRFTMNSTLGLAGFLDVATPSGLPKHTEDFGQTLGVWGLPPGPYVVLPIWGPSSLRDTVGRVPDYYSYYPWTYLDDRETSYLLSGMSVINLRSQLMGLEGIVGNNLFDPYATIRDAWMERREYLIADRKQPDSTSEDDLMIEELEMLEADP